MTRNESRYAAIVLFMAIAILIFGYFTRKAADRMFEAGVLIGVTVWIEHGEDLETRELLALAREKLESNE